MARTQIRIPLHLARLHPQLSHSDMAFLVEASKAGQNPIEAFRSLLSHLGIQAYDEE